ncbi:MAG: sulfotransferase [Solirubrobacterales bacterium]|jgi:hypothetical protein|nr:sulfotransferase [Solirubrobacterales bacterium]
MTPPAEPPTPTETASAPADGGEPGDSRASGEAPAGASTQGAAAAGRRVPDFFIVGHEKCGTTALYMMLRGHPQIYMPDLKEPRFFAPELRSRFRDRATDEVKRLHTLDGYLSLFDDARPQQRAGEASPNYLRSTTAAGRIAEVQPDARIIAIVREPAAFLSSFHLQSVDSHLEDERDFRKAIALEDSRREGRNIPRRSHSPAALLYSDHVRYVEQLRRYDAVFPREHVLVLVYEDFRRDNEAAVREVLRFLEVDEQVAVEPVETKALQGVRSMRLHQLRQALWVARNNPPAAPRLWRMVNALTPRHMRSDAAWALWRRLLHTEPPAPDEELMLELRRRFKPEVVALSDYLGRDLVSLWGYDGID